MINDYLNISEIEAYIDSLISIAKEKDEDPINISDNVFYTSVKNPLPDSIKKFLLIEIPNEGKDLKAYAKQTVIFNICAKEVNGEKDIGTLGKMEKEINRLIEYNKYLNSISESFVYIMEKSGSLSSYDEKRRFHVNSIRVKIYIV